MKVRPILFSSSMVRAILEGRKSQTRRLRWQPAGLLWVRETFVIESTIEYGTEGRLPIDGRPVRTVDLGFDWGDDTLIPHYRATEPEPHIVPADLEDSSDDRTRWKSARFMPRWASRITLEVTAAKVERLQEITPADAIAEGIGPFANSETIDCETTNPRDVFAGLWDSLHGAGAWASNPEVVAITFRPHLQNVDAFLERSAA